MEFIASLRLGSYATMSKEWSTREGGGGWVHEEMRTHLMGIIRELAHDYPTDGVELDFAAAPGGSPHCLRSEDLLEHGHLIPEWLEQAADGSSLPPCCRLDGAAWPLGWWPLTAID